MKKVLGVYRCENDKLLMLSTSLPCDSRVGSWRRPSYARSGPFRARPWEVPEGAGRGSGCRVGAVLLENQYRVWLTGAAIPVCCS